MKAVSLSKFKVALGLVRRLTSLSYEVAPISRAAKETRWDYVLQEREKPMTTKLSDDHRQAIEQEGNNPFHLVDATTNIHYVLMRADQYEKVKAVFEREEHDFDPREAYPFVDEVMRDDDAVDPTLESYQSYAKRES